MSALAVLAGRLGWLVRLAGFVGLNGWLGLRRWLRWLGVVGPGADRADFLRNATVRNNPRRPD